MDKLFHAARCATTYPTHLLGMLAMLSVLLVHTSTNAAEPPRIPVIPLVQGLTTVSAVPRASGDEEQIMTVTAATPALTTFSVEFRTLVGDKIESTTKTRQVRREDFVGSNRLNLVFQDGDATLFPGATLSQLSFASLQQLKNDGKVSLIVGTIANYSEQESPASIMAVAAGRKYFRGTLERVGTAPVPLSVQVNGVTAVLPTIHGKGLFSVGDERMEIAVWVLDDAQNPMVLKSQQGKSFGQTVRINFPTAKLQTVTLQQALSSGNCRTNLNGIYFDFASATLLPQSTPALQAVADLLAANPNWSIRVEGHTDNVGGDAQNAALSTRRANAVRDTLATAHKIAASRLQASGEGAKRPVASNDSLEGRAANRRVELSRSCS